MSAHLQTLLLAITVGLAYWWLQTPALSFYSLQAFSLAVVLYFVAKRFSHAKFWHIAPTAQSFEMILATFAFLIIIGATGNTDSILFPLVYVHLFFLVFSTQLSTSIAVGLLLIVFHYALQNTGLTPTELSNLITIPLMLMFFLFTKHQYNEAVRERKIIEGEEKALTSSLAKEKALTALLNDFVQPKLAQLKEMSLYAEKNRDAIVGQIFLMQMEIRKHLENDQRT